MGLAQDDHVIETLSSNGADKTFDVRILPRRPRSDEHLGDTEPGQPASEAMPIDGITIAQ